MCQNGNNYNCRLIAKDKVGMVMSFERYTQSTKYDVYNRGRREPMTE